MKYSAGSRDSARRLTPSKRAVGNFHFWVELDGILAAGFTEVSGLEAEIEVEEFREGGVNEYVHKLPKGVRYPNIVLKRGLTKDMAMLKWYEATLAGKYARKSGAIILQALDGTEVGRWNFFDAYPVKWIGPSLNAMSSEVAVETVEIAHNGFKRAFGSSQP